MCEETALREATVYGTLDPQHKELREQQQRRRTSPNEY